jgi:MFS family permease
LSSGHFVDQGEQQAMSVLFPAIRDSLNFGYQGFGQIAGWRGLVQFVTSPLWGYLADRFSRKWVVVLGTGLWGIWTLACGFVGSYEQLFWLRVISGAGLGCLLPSTFSIVSDYFGPEARGRANGFMQAIGFVGIIISVLVLGWIASQPEFGWRWGFYLLGSASILSGFLIAIFVDEPTRGAAEPELEGVLSQTDSELYRIRFSDLGEVLRIPTLWVTLFQGIFGRTPWVVMGTFLVTWLVDERGISQARAPLIFAIIIIGQAVAAFLGGIVADRAHRWNPSIGRILVSQISIFNGIWITLVIFSTPMDFKDLIAIAGVMGILIGWAGPGGRDPILQGVLKPELRSSAYSLIGAFEGGFSALAAFLAGWLAESYGLNTAMLICVPVSWGVLLLCWFAYYFTYPLDATRLRKEMDARSQEYEAFL